MAPRRGGTVPAWRISALMAALVPALAAAARAVPRVSLAELERGGGGAAAASAFATPGAPGALVVTGCAEVAAARATALPALAACGPGLPRASQVGPAGVRRATLAGFAGGPLDEGEGGGSGGDDACGAALHAALDPLRDAVGAVAHVALARLDGALGGSTGGFFAAAAASPDSLDHFHVYAAAPTETPATGATAPAAPALEAHTDVGVAVAMAAALEGHPGAPADGEATSRGLTLFGADGTPIEPEIPPDGVLVLLGEGARTWAPGAAAASLAVPAHAMRVAGERAWFGRMVLPPRRTPAPGAPNVTFGEWHEGARRAFKSWRDGGDADAAPAIGCSPAPAGPAGDGGRRRLLDDEASCGAGEVYCWMSCVSVPEALPCLSKDAVCLSPSGKVWPTEFEEGEHCQECYPACPHNDSPPSGFCNARIPATTMFMDGFHVGGESTDPCVLFLFKGWDVSTGGLLALSFFATAALGVCVEALVALRRQRAALNATLPPKNLAYEWLRWGELLMLYGIQATLGYALMLLAMTYQFELLIAVVLGLTVGHATFNRKAPVAESNDACCRHEDEHMAAAAVAPAAAPAAGPTVVKVVGGNTGVAGQPSCCTPSEETPDRVIA